MEQPVLAATWHTIPCFLMFFHPKTFVKFNGTRCCATSPILEAGSFLGQDIQRKNWKTELFYDSAHAYTTEVIAKNYFRIYLFTPFITNFLKSYLQISQQVLSALLSGNQYFHKIIFSKMVLFCFLQYILKITSRCKLF